MIKLPKFGHINTSTLKFKSRDKISFLTSWTEIMTLTEIIQNSFILRRSRVVIFADIQIVSMFIKAIFKDSKKSKELEIVN